MANPVNIEKARMKAAFSEVQKINSYKTIKEFESYVNKVPAFIMTNGLGNTFAYIAGQSKSTWKKVKEAIENWLKDNNSGFKEIFDNKDFMKELVKSSDDQMRALTQEVLAYLNWLRKFAKARKIELETQKQNTNSNG